MACSCTGNCDLINLNPLVLSDTFHTWFDRTNEMIGHLNYLNVYDVKVGMTDGGLTSISSCVNSNYNGYYTLKVNIGPGIGLGTVSTPNYYLNHVMIDTVGLTQHGPTGYDVSSSLRIDQAFPDQEDWYIFSDSSDSTLGTGNGTPKKIKAKQMLPRVVYTPKDFQFNGDVSIVGNLIVSGTQSTIDSNDLLIEDKAIELAYRRFVAIEVTGSTSDTFPAVGATFNYYDTGIGSTANPTTIGHISNVEFAGTYTRLQLHQFIEGGVRDIAFGGRLSITGTNFDFTIAAGPTTTTEFYNDDNLDESGIIVKGASGDKAFLWVYREGPNTDIYRAFISSDNLGVSGSSNAIISSKFRSYGYADSSANDTFQFMGYNTGKPKVIIGGATGTANQYAQYGYWSIQHDNVGGTGEQQPLVWRFKQYSSGTEDIKYRLWSGASGHTYPTVTVTNQGNNRVANFAQGLNVDFLDGAHGTTLATPWSIPVSLSSGYLDIGNGETSHGFINPEILNRTWRAYNQPGHGLVLGDIVRINPDTGGLTYAMASSREYAEVLGIVSKVEGDKVFVTSKGYVFDLEKASPSSNINTIMPMVTGHCYFLSPVNPGRLIPDPETGTIQVALGDVRKPLMLAITSKLGYFVNYLGIVNGGEETDLVEVQGIVPVGQIMPFAGRFQTIPYGWLACDGSRLEKGLWSDLYDVIGQRYYHEGTLQPEEPIGTDITIFMPNEDHFGLLPDDLLKLTTVVDGTTYSANTKVVSITDDGVVLVEAFSFGDTITLAGRSVKIYGRTQYVNGEGTSIFFVPDLRTRTPIGTTEGLSGTFGGINSNLGNIGGATGVQLAPTNIPEHYHPLYYKTVLAGEDTIIGVGGLRDGSDSSWPDTISPRYTNDGPTELGGQAPTAVNVLQPYIAINWIIRAKRGLSALILSGHNHDGRYHFLNDDIQITGNALLPNGDISNEGNWRVRYKNEVLGQYPRMSRDDESNNGLFRCYYNADNVSDSVKSVGSIRGYGDFSLYMEGITGDNSLGGIRNEVIFDFKSKTSQMTVYGHLANYQGLGHPQIVPNIRFAMLDTTIPYGYISGLTSPASDTHAVNKYYSDTSDKLLKKQSTVYYDWNISHDPSVFNVARMQANFGAGSSTTPTTILRARYDQGNILNTEGNSRLQVFTFGDFSVFGEGLTSYLNYTGHSEETFTVDSPLSRVRISGRGQNFSGYQGVNQYSPDPVLEFVNRTNTNRPTGRIKGLTAPVANDQAANKWYIDDKFDTSAANRLAKANIQDNGDSWPAGVSLTGVAFYEFNDFIVNDEGLVTLNSSSPRFSQFSVSSEGTPYQTTLTPPANNTIGGAVRVVTKQGLPIGDRESTNILTVNASNANPSDWYSAHQIHVGGDFAVWGDAWGKSQSRPATDKKVFAVNSSYSNISVFGGHTNEYVLGSQASDLGATAPSLDFVDARGSARGVIRGLTAPTSADQAANKYYVDASKLDNSILTQGKVELLGSFENFAVVGTTGFSIKTTNNLLTPYLTTTPYKTRTVLGVAANDFTNLALTTRSAHIVNVGGDFAVWGDAWGRSGNVGANSYRSHGNTAFAVNSTVSNVQIFGGYVRAWENGEDRTSSVGAGQEGYSSPTLQFIDARGGSRGVISGLTAPSSDSHAVNKYYSDSSDKTIKKTNFYNDFSVRHDSAFFGVTRFAANVGAGSDTTTILRIRADEGNVGETDNSRCQIFGCGDFTIFGDGLTNNGNRTGHSQPVLAVDPHLNRVTIQGRNNTTLTPTVNSTTTTQFEYRPELVFKNSADANVPLGKISGLTAPTANDQAANKWYVDQQLGSVAWRRREYNLIETQPSSGSEITPFDDSFTGYPNDHTALTPGTWKIEVILRTNTSNAPGIGSFPATLQYDYGAGTFNYTVTSGSSSANNAPTTFIFFITLTSGQNLRFIGTTYLTWIGNVTATKL